MSILEHKALWRIIRDRNAASIKQVLPIRPDIVFLWLNSQRARWIADELPEILIWTLRLVRLLNKVELATLIYL